LGLVLMFISSFGVMVLHIGSVNINLFLFIRLIALEVSSSILLFH
jgi:hypothetical protein